MKNSPRFLGSFFTEEAQKNALHNILRISASAVLFIFFTTEPQRRRVHRPGIRAVTRIIIFPENHFSEPVGFAGNLCIFEAMIGKLNRNLPVPAM
jgi:hypothetical protein